MPTSPTSEEDYLSDYIQNHRVPLPQLSPGDYAYNQAIDEEFASIGSNGTGDSDWQENWLFKKQKSSNHDASSIPTAHVGMLVPSPTEDVKAQIGDQTTDEVSDLSEAGSDAESDMSDDENVASIRLDRFEPVSLVSQNNEDNSILLEAKNEVIVTYQQTPAPVIRNISQDLISEDDINNSIQKLDAVVNGSEYGGESSSNEAELTQNRTEAETKKGAEQIMPDSLIGVDM